MKSRLKSSLVDTLDPILFVFRVTIVYLSFLLDDALLLRVISWSFGDVISHFAVAETLLEYIQLLSAVGAAAIYVLHFAFTLSYEARHILKEGNTKDAILILEDGSGKKEEIN